MTKCISLPSRKCHPFWYQSRRCVGRLAETDTAIIAHFAEAVRPEARPILDDETRALDDLVSRRRQLIDMIVTETNRKNAIANKPIVREIDRHLLYLQKLLIELDGDIDDAIRASPVCREKEELMVSVPGVAQ